MLKKILCGAALLCVTGFSSAAVITQEFTVARQLTNFTNTISYNLFDDMGGTRQLESVEFTLLARSSGIAEVENRNATSTRITATLSTDIALINTSGVKLVEAAPFLTRSELLAAFDGVIDFDGPSGVEFLNLNTNDFSNLLINDAMALMDFVGAGTTSINFTAKALSQITGGGNLTSSFTTFASGDVKVIYTYSDVPVNVSAPAHIALVLLGLVGFAGIRKFRK